MDNTYKDITDKDINGSTNDRLAEMLEEIADGAMKAAKDNRQPQNVVDIMNKEVVILKESARRLRVKPREIFNDEAFSTL